MEADCRFDRRARTSDVWRLTCCCADRCGDGQRRPRRDPARGGPFQDFAEAAYYSVGGKESVERQVRTVLENVAKRPKHDRFDRDSFRYKAGEDGYVPVVEHRDGQRIVQNDAVWAPSYFDPCLDNPEFKSFGEEAEAVQSARRQRPQS